METKYLKSSATYVNNFRKYDNLEKWEIDDLFKNGEFKFFLKDLKLKSKKTIGLEDHEGIFNHQYTFTNYRGDIVRYNELYMNHKIIAPPKRNFNFPEELRKKPVVSKTGYNFKTKKEVYKHDTTQNKEVKIITGRNIILLILV